MKFEDVKKDKRVKYLGNNRTYLKQYPKAILTGETSSISQSALVAFYNGADRVADTAWVGVGYLEPVSYVHQETIDQITKKRDALAAELAGFDAAIKALQDLG